MITVGPMGLHQVEATDPMEPYFVGGEHSQDVARISSHDHSGGLLGAPVAVTIPDGSITTADLDPSVLAPYALTDGSKPFTGQVTMQADAVIRDALLFGQQGSALAPDATLSRTGAGALRADTHLGVGVDPAAWAGGVSPTLQVGTGALMGPGSALYIGQNTYYDTAWRAITTGYGTRIDIGGGVLAVHNAPSVAGGVAQAFTQRVSVSPTGTVTVNPDAGAAHLAGGATLDLVATAGVNLRPTGMSNTLAVQANNSWGFGPLVDNQGSCGHPAARWTLLAAVAGAINTSSRTMKEGITPLDPSRAMQAVRNTEAVTFDYVAPERGPEWYDLPDDPEQAEAVLAQRLTAAPLEAAARHQSGFVAEDCDPLFLVGEGQTSPGNTAGILLAALQALDARVTQLEGAP